MLFWIILFLIVVALSFILAFLSMKDYKAAPKDFKSDYGLFLIRNSKNLSPQILASISQKEGKNHIISVERLIKGIQAALVIYAPKELLAPFLETLNLLELEDYTDLDPQSITLWEIGTKQEQVSLYEPPFNIPVLKPDEQVWEQIVVKGNLVQIRVAAVAANLSRRKQILESLVKSGFLKVPRPYSAEKMLKFYKLRSIGMDKFALKVKVEYLLNIISLK